MTQYKQYMVTTFWPQVEFITDDLGEARLKAGQQLSRFHQPIGIFTSEWSSCHHRYAKQWQLFEVFDNSACDCNEILDVWGRRNKRRG